MWLQSKLLLIGTAILSLLSTQLDDCQQIRLTDKAASTALCAKSLTACVQVAGMVTTLCTCQATDCVSSVAYKN